MTPNCPSCAGETELNGNGGISCFFCGFDSGARMPGNPHPTPPHVMETIPIETDKQGNRVAVLSGGQRLPIIDNLP